MTKYINLKVRLTEKEFEQVVWALGSAEFEVNLAWERENSKATIRAKAKLWKAYKEAIG